MKRWIVAASLAALMMPVPAAAMTVDQFLARVNALKAKGLLAMFSSDIRVLKAEVDDANAAWQADKNARRAAGKPPLNCAPPGASLSRDEFLAALAELSPAQRAMSMREGFAYVAIAKFPCR